MRDVEECSLSEFVALSDVPEHLPARGGVRFSRAAVYRWAAQGKRGVRLHSVRIGAAQFTTIAWLQEFIRETNPVSRQQPKAGRDQRASGGATEIAAATRAKLAKHGLRCE